MDILTQGLLGGVLAQVVATKQDKKLATFVGVFAGLLADADIFIYSSNDPLLNIEFHRHFTHSIFFIPLGAAIAMALLWPFLRKHIGGKALYLYCLAGFSMSGLLDAFTSYGTHLFWPLSNERIAWNIISIVDPIFTTILLVTLIIGLRKKDKKIAVWGLMFCAVYLSSGFIQLQRAQTIATELALSRGHLITKHIVKPTLANQVLWRSVYEYNNRFYIDAIRVGYFSDNKIYQGQAIAKFVIENEFPDLNKDSLLYSDIKRFSQFSDGFIAYDVSRPNVVADVRYSMLPDSSKPLWGIIIDINKPQFHAQYQFFRENTQAIRNTFYKMLFGEYTQ